LDEDALEQVSNHRGSSRNIRATAHNRRRPFQSTSMLSYSKLARTWAGSGLTPRRVHELQARWPRQRFRPGFHLSCDLRYTMCSVGRDLDRDACALYSQIPAGLRETSLEFLEHALKPPIKFLARQFALNLGLLACWNPLDCVRLRGTSFAAAVRLKQCLTR